MIAQLALSLALGARAAAPDQLAGNKRLLHVLNRLTMGARPEDIQALEERGLDAWLDEQLHPERLDDSACERRAAGLAREAARLVLAVCSKRQLQQVLRSGRAVDLGDPRFFAVSSFRSEPKTDFEFAASALRVSEAELSDPGRLTALKGGRRRFLSELFSGEKGAPARAEAATLLGPGETPRDKRAIVAFVDAYLGGEVSDATLKRLERLQAKPGLTAAELAIAVLSSPDFQRK